MTIRTRTNTGKALLGAIVSLCFVLQQVLLPLHFNQVEHTFVGAQGLVTHDGHIHAHGHDSSVHSLPGHDEEHQHDPHPAEDHLAEMSGAYARPPVFLRGFVAPVPESGTVISAVIPLIGELTLHETRDPRPPPFLAASAARAPPAIV